MEQALGPVLVTGGSGFVGGRLIVALRKRELDVLALVRSKASATKVEALGATPLLADLADPETLAPVVAGCQTVLHAAGHLRGWDSIAAFRTANVHATRNLLDAARASGVRSFVQVGASAVVMGDPAPMLGVDERQPLQFPSWAPYIATKAEAERLVLEANTASMRTCVVRPPFVWGPASPMLDQIAKRARAGQFRFVDGGGQPMSTCHVDNVCHGVLLAAERGLGGQAYFVADAEDSTLEQVMTRLLATRGIDAGRKSIGFRLAWTMCTVIEPIWRLTLGYRQEPPITRQVLRMAAQPFTLCITKARSELGYEPLVSWPDGLREMGFAAPKPASPPPAPAHPAATGSRPAAAGSAPL